MQGQEPNPHPLAFVSLERASNSQPVPSLLWGPGVAAGSFLLEAEVQALSLGRCLSPPAGPRRPASPAVPEGARRGPFLQAPESPAGGGFSRKASAAAGSQPGLPGPEVLCQARVPGAHELYLQRCSLRLGRPASVLRSPCLPYPPSLSARSDPAACVFPGCGRQTAGHCVIHVPRSPMCVAVCVTDGAPGACEGRGVNFLLKGPNTCVRSFLYYFGETRGGTRKPFCPRPRFRDKIRPHPSAAQIPRRWESPAALPQALGREAHSASLFKARDIHPPRSFVCQGRGWSKGAG